jgi:hypothetical protein
MASTHTPLFNKRLVRQSVSAVAPERLAAARVAIAPWLEHLTRGTLDQQSEVQVHGPFLASVFGTVLGYRGFGRAQAGQWDLRGEEAVKRGSIDAALGRFRSETAGPSVVIAPMELKGSRHPLDSRRGRSMTPVEQAWSYANRTPASLWVLVSNYRETRLYSKQHGMGAYERFLLQELSEDQALGRFLALLGRDALLGTAPDQPSPLTELLLSSEHREHENITRLYAEYRDLRRDLFSHVLAAHPDVPAGDLLGAVQKVLDRVLFIAFAEDLRLLPANSLALALAVSPYHPQPVWQNLLGLFRAVDQGDSQLDIPAYNGGLFRPDPLIDCLSPDNATCQRLTAFGAYDFGDDISVDVLGHVFEQSIIELEDLRTAAEAGELQGHEAGTRKAATSRQAEGVFYTPAFVTDFLVRETLGRTLAEREAQAHAERGRSKRDEIAAWEDYQRGLGSLRVLDLACGSGAFLNAAFDRLSQEHGRTSQVLTTLRGGAGDLFDPNPTVLRDCLFGVDRNGEAVEIAKLALWLKTAEHGKKLTALDQNLVKGNSVVSDPSLDPWAVDWDGGSLGDKWTGGFDVILGNPPYVRQELLTDHKAHWKTHFETFEGTADLFVYFFERSIKLLRPGGRLGFIVSNKWLRGGYAAKLRKLLAERCTVDVIVDFGHAPIFPDAAVHPVILTLRRAPPPPDHAVRVTRYPREHLRRELIATFVDTHAFSLPQASLGAQSWTLQHPHVDALLARIQAAGPPLASLPGLRPLYGIKTGYNNAYLMDQAACDAICRDDPASRPLFKPYLRGRDMARWSPVDPRRWMLLMRSSSDQDWPWAHAETDADAEALFQATYPGVFAHMKSHEASLRARKGQGRFWWELIPCRYQAALDAGKIGIHRYMYRSKFGLVREGMLINDALAFIPSEDPWVLGVLNSSVFWFLAYQTYPHKLNETVAMDQVRLRQAPMPEPTDEQRAVAEAGVAVAVACSDRLHEVRRDMLLGLATQFDVRSPGKRLPKFDALGEDDFIAEVAARRPKKRALGPQDIGKLRTLYRESAPALQDADARLFQAERSVDRAIQDAFGLTDADRAVMAASDVQRMPPGWSAPR